MLLLEWGLLSVSPIAAAAVVYLQISGLGPMLGSGFWLIVTERFDPHTAKRRFGQIAGLGTLGGLIGGLLAERVTTLFGISAMLPVLAVLNIVCAWQIRTLALSSAPARTSRALEMTPELLAAPTRTGLQVLARAPYLRNLAAMVLLGTLSAAILDYVFKAQAVAMLGNGENLLRFFALYYAAVSLITFVVQTSSARVVLEKAGLALTAGTPSLALVGGGLGALLAPGLESAIVARGAESVFRGSLHRAAYELFYTPIAVSEKRAAKSLIDVGMDRLGDAAGGLAVRLTLFAAPAMHLSIGIVLAIGASALALVAASRLNRGYIQTLERSLLDRAVELDLSDAEDMTTRTTMLRTLTMLRAVRKSRPGAFGPPAAAAADSTSLDSVSATASGVLRSLDSDMLQILALRSRDRDRILRVLHNEQGLPAPLIPHVIPLLAWDPVANDAMFALRKIAEERVGELIDALIDPNQEFSIRRRLARVFSVCVSQRAADGLLLGLEDQRFEVRYQCARSLASILAKNPRVRIDAEFVFEIVRREAAVGRPVWESQRLLPQAEDRDDNFFVDDVVRDRASRSLAHVFTLLALVLPTEPLQIAFRGLHADDQNLRGTALEYLEGVLPPAIRDALWPYLEDSRPRRRESRPREEILADLLRSNDSIMMNIEELKRRSAPEPKPWQTT
jgi:AAA family ATP:ADP antiporter